MPLYHSQYTTNYLNRKTFFNIYYICNMKNKIKDIISGWSNFIDKSEVTEKIAKQRASICAKCEHAKKGILLGFIKDSLKEIEGYYCNDCERCPLSAKVRTKNDVCEKWKTDTN